MWYIMGLWKSQPLTSHHLINPFSAGIDFRRRHQILTSKVNLRTERVIFLNGRRYNIGIQITQKQITKTIMMIAD